MKRLHRTILVVCAFRSGSKHMSNVLKRSHVKVGHEQVKEEGCVSGYFVTYNSPQGKRSPHDFQPLHHEGDIPNQYKFEHVWHMVRDPLKSIGSCRDVLSRPVMEWAKFALGVEVNPRGADKTIWAARYWLATNLAAEKIADWRFKVEDIPKVYAQMGAKICETWRAWPTECPDVSKTMGRSYRTMKRFRPAKEIYAEISYPTIDEIKAVDKELGKHIAEKIKEYGYHAKKH